MDHLGFEVHYVESRHLGKIYLEITDRCNLDCAICYRKGGSWQEASMALDFLKKIHHDLSAFDHRPTVVIGGIGEPTVHPGFVEILEIFKKFPLVVTTNGVQLSPEVIEGMVNHVEAITFSVDGVGRAFEAIRGVGVKGVVDSIRRLQKSAKEKKKTIKVDLQFVLSRENMEELEGVIELARDLRVDHLVVSHLVPQTSDLSEAVLYGMSEDPQMTAWAHRIRSKAIKEHVHLKLPPMYVKSDKRCAFVEDAATYVTAHGQVVPCYRLSHRCHEVVLGREKVTTPMVFGDLKNESLLSIWNQRNYQKMRRFLHFQEFLSCIDCDFAQGCEVAKDTEEDCYGNRPGCGDCLWNRGLVVCP